MKLKAMREDETIVKRWSRPITLGGGALVLVSGPKGLRLLKRDIMSDDARTYKEITIKVGTKQNGGPIYSHRVTEDVAAQHAAAWGYEEIG